MCIRWLLNHPLSLVAATCLALWIQSCPAEAERNQPVRIALVPTESAKAEHLRQALSEAVKIWEQSLVQTRPAPKPIQISVDYYEFESSSTALATAGPASKNWPPAYADRNRQAKTLATSIAEKIYYPAPLLASIVPEGSDKFLAETTPKSSKGTAKGKYHGWLNLNSKKMSPEGRGYFGKEGPLDSGQWDAISVIAHELGHVLGFTGWLGNEMGRLALSGQAYSAFDVEVAIWTGDLQSGPLHVIGEHSGSYLLPEFLVWDGRRGWGTGAYRAQNSSKHFAPLFGDRSIPGSYVHHFADAPDLRDDTMIWQAANGRYQRNNAISSCCLADLGWHIVPILIQLSRLGGAFWPNFDANGTSKAGHATTVNKFTITPTLTGLASPAARILGSASSYAHLEWKQQPQTTLTRFGPLDLELIITGDPAVGWHRIPVLFHYIAEGETYNVLRHVHLYVTGEDSDGDGISDAHELCPPEFPDCANWPFDPNVVDGNNNGVADGYDDWDGDNLCNGLEFLLGTDPFTPNWDDVPAAADDASQEIVIRNQGAWPVELSDAYIDGEDADQFLLEGIPAFSTIEPGRSVALRVYHVGMDNAAHDDAWVQIEYTSANRARSKTVTLVGDDTAKRIDF